MNTPAHLLLGAALFADPLRRRTTAAALLGAILPDLSLYLMVGVSLVLLQIPAQVVFDELYFSPAWQQVFAIDNSFLVWGGVLGLGLVRRSPVLIAFAGAGLVHLLTDFALHHDDGRAHFWPITGWIFESPVSYWDSGHHAGLVAPLEGALSLGCFVVLWRRYLDWGMRALFGLFLLLEFIVIRQWLTFF